MNNLLYNFTNPYTFEIMNNSVPNKSTCNGILKNMDITVPDKLAHISFNNYQSLNSLEEEKIKLILIKLEEKQKYYKIVLKTYFVLFMILSLLVLSN